MTRRPRTANRQPRVRVTVDDVAALVTFAVKCGHCGQTVEMPVTALDPVSGEPPEFCSAQCRRRRKADQRRAAKVAVCGACGGAPTSGVIRHHGVLLCDRHWAVWYLSCRRKLRYQVEADADAKVPGHDTPMQVYYCPICHGHHLTKATTLPPPDWTDAVYAVAHAVAQAAVTPHPSLQDQPAPTVSA